MTLPGAGRHCEEFSWNIIAKQNQVLLLASPPTGFNYPLQKNVLFTKLLAGTPTKAGVHCCVRHCEEFSWNIIAKQNQFPKLCGNLMVQLNCR
jgi:hypothetical protein